MENEKIVVRNTESFIKKARIAHGDKYDYSKVEYTRGRDKVCIICPEHGEFWQRAEGHCSGVGCKECGKINTLKNSGKVFDTESFIRRAIGVHGDRYDYSLVEYTGMKSDVKIICKDHGEFLQKPVNHLSGFHCNRCATATVAKNRGRVYDRDSFIEKSKEIHGDKYDYSKVVYNKSSENVTIVCAEHGLFSQQASVHLRGGGCPTCSNIARGLDHRLTQEEFIERCKEVHGDKYDYSKTEYARNDIPVTIICVEHGEFTLQAGRHIQGQGCKECGIREGSLKGSIANINRARSTFVEKANKVHNNKYTYDEVDYKRANQPVKITCPIHGTFEQKPSTHLSGCGCQECAMDVYRSTFLISQEEMIERFRKIHGDRFDYSKMNYINNNTKVTIICKKHGEFEQLPRNHYSTGGCPACGKEVRNDKMKLDTEEAVRRFQEIHGDKYDYSKVEYKDNKTKVTIICKEHGEFRKTPQSIIAGNKCPKCAKENLHNALAHTQEEVIQIFKRVHNDRYDYSLVKYNTLESVIKIICPVHGVFEQKAKNHINSKGCKKCNISKLELRVMKCLQKLNIKNKFQKSFTECRDKLPLSFDFWIRTHKVLIECQGFQHYKPLDRFGGEKAFIGQVRRDEIKRQFCRDKGYTLLEIPYWYTDHDIENMLWSELCLM